MKKFRILLFLISICTIFTFSLAACDETQPAERYEVNVTCGEGGTYSLSPEQETYEKDTSVTLTVTPSDGYETDAVSVNGQAVSLTENSYTFRVTADTQIDVSFRVHVTTYSVTVTCGEHGSYKLSHESPVAENTEVTLTVTPENDFGIDKVTVNGETVTPVDGKCTFTVTKDTTVEITFKPLSQIFSAEEMGDWNPNMGSGTAGSGITVQSGNILFNGVAREVTASEGTYSFQIVDDEGTTFSYSFTFEEIFGQKSLLVLSYRDPNASETTTLYYLKSGVDYFTYNAVEGSRWEEAIGFWSGTIPIEVNKAYFLVEGMRAIVMEEGETFPNTPGKILVGNTVYTVSFAIDKDLTNLILAIVLENADGKIYCSRVADPDPVLVPQHAGTYKTEDESHTILIDAEGKLYYDDTFCELYSGDSMGQQETYFFTYSGVVYDVDFLKKQSNTVNHLWVRQEKVVLDEGVYFYGEDYPFNMSYTVVLNVGDHGTATLTASKEPNDAGFYVSGTTLTFSIKADAGYLIEYCYFNNRSWENFSDSAKNKSEYELVYTLNNNFYDWYSTSTIRFYVTFKVDPSAAAASETVGASAVGASVETSSVGTDVLTTSIALVPLDKHDSLQQVDS